MKNKVAEGILPVQRCTEHRAITMMRYCMFLIMIVIFPFPSFAGVFFEQESRYEVVNGDTLSIIGGKLGVDWKRIAKDNGLNPSNPLSPGRKLLITATKIIPRTMQKGILIDLPGRMLYLFDRGVPLLATPVGLGMPKGDGKKGWETPAGKFTIRGKLKSPPWKVPKSIQEEMRREGQAVRESYPPGPKNPVGGYVLLTTIPGIMIHETIDPLSVSRFKSHGCVRLLREDMEQLFVSVNSGMSGETVYAPVKIASLHGGQVFMEVNEDVYKNIKDMQVEARRLLGKANLLGNVDLQTVAKVIQEKKGVPEDITAK